MSVAGFRFSHGRLLHSCQRLRPRRSASTKRCHVVRLTTFAARLAPTLPTAARRPSSEPAIASATSAGTVATISTAVAAVSAVPSDSA